MTASPRKPHVSGTGVDQFRARNTKLNADKLQIKVKSSHASQRWRNGI
jgi:hypothetical protein